MTKDELIELTKSDMLFEEIPLFESKGLTPSDMTYKWEVEDLPDGGMVVTMEVYAMGEYITSKSKKIKLLEE